MKHICCILYLTITALTLAACNLSGNQGKYIFVNNIPTRIDGEWIDTNGIISSFHDGIFETRAADTKEKLSEGTYHYINTHYVEIEIHSLLRGTISRASCIISHDTMRLLCTSDTGSQFLLKRKT
ncbi:Outer membrane lipoprotein omp10 precursor (Minor outer membrane protein omp10) (10 kDa OMP) [Bartonella clarridgeiae 73]|uniref:Outer membrane lipoprotein omp10 (Minor outer membrane protein omp10) (10 kDa OMP) n=1 Tax=Bartonella clarridgeiae (strain CCUG 45776 / CIP 104772 / 73) TaxID=696125 RepID=E6YIT6_BARC7|nr:hypothetical protein [Bartonella clarridgeiae]WCR54660.1 MAG: Outer membrane lipoprotein precursor [Bartonella clarridgeiae]CBI76774.1 Outer membrane lipoprotein omp10 precursor (Minor outer membrane protein omp10) (10 kDa OMP) [Bartonella clarridgeiae 73]